MEIPFPAGWWKYLPQSRQWRLALIGNFPYSPAVYVRDVFTNKQILIPPEMYGNLDALTSYILVSL